MKVNAAARTIPLRQIPKPPLIKSPFEAMAVMFGSALCVLGVWKLIELLWLWSGP